MQEDFPYFKASTFAQERGNLRALQLLTTFCFSPRAAANLPTPPSASIAISKMSIASLYHSSDLLRNAKVIHTSVLLELMNETNGERLKRLRLEKGLSQKSLAHLSGIAQSTIASIEGDTRGYGLSIISIAKILDVTTDYLQNKRVGLVEEPSPAWPFSTFSQRQFEQLDPSLREEIEDRLLGAITRQEKTGTHR